eukprot:m.39957 g.39957  ORF g.39957 m.39957 type:complete len:532 (-) comp9613_c0_seq2:75-1670(-)
MALASLLPKPMHSKSKWDDESDEDEEIVPSTVTTIALNNTIPPYGKRKGWVPRTIKDFGTGGAFPEIHVAQYPLDVGRQDKTEHTKAVLPVTLDAEGKVQYDQLLRQGNAKDKIIHSTYDSLVPVQITNDDPRRELPAEEEIQETTEKTKAALLSIVDGKVAAAQSTRIQKQTLEPQFIRYTSAQQGTVFNSGAKQRVIRMVEAQHDPLEPPKHKTNKKIPRGPPSPPAPVLHSPPRKVTAKEQADWKIPPCISSWKNQKGYTIPLDKRLAADGRGLQDVSINDQFAKFSEALFIAERESRKGIKLRQDIEKKAALKEKDRKEESLRNLAQMAREERAGIRPADEEAEEVEERDQIRFERQRDRERERRIAAAAPDKRNRLMRDRERDVSEKIALGLPAQNTGGGTGFDTRLYNQSQGMDSGFKEDDHYDVYDKPFRGEKATNIYRPSKKKEADYTDEDIEKIKKAERFHRPDKGFAGTDGDGTATRDGPVQFEKGDEDLFGIDKLLTDAKEGTRKRGREDDDDKSRKSRR